MELPFLTLFFSAASFTGQSSGFSPPISDEQHWPSDNATSGGAVTRRAATSSNGSHPLLSDEAALRLDPSASGDTMTGLGRRKQLLGGDGDAMAAKP